MLTSTILCAVTMSGQVISAQDPSHLTIQQQSSWGGCMSAWQLSLRGPVFVWAQARHTDNCEGNIQGHFPPVAVHDAGYPYSATQQDVIFVNGGLQPIIRMAPGVPQLWRIVNAAWKVQGLTFPHCITSKAEIPKMNTTTFRMQGA